MRTHRSCGFSYIGLLIFIAIMSLLATSVVQTGAIAQRRAAEEELLGIGLEFKNAIKSYFESTPIGMPAIAPRSLEDLLRDPRLPGVKRHLRKIYNDPLTGEPDWVLIRSEDGGILGVYSSAQGEPIRRDNFPDEFFHFKNKKKYSDWVFVYGVVCTDAGCELPGQKADNAPPGLQSAPQAQQSEAAAGFLSGGSSVPAPGE